MSYYAVRAGRKPGIYMTWAECQKQVTGYKGAQFKKFETRDEAEAFIGGQAAKASIDLNALKPGQMAVYVDGSYNIETQHFGYGIVSFTQGGKQTTCGALSGDYADHRNVAGELLAATEAIRYALDQGMSELFIYYDYAGIRHWALGEWKTNLELTRSYKAFVESVQDRLKLTFVKVAAHTGDVYNEEADRLAKKGCGLL